MGSAAFKAVGTGDPRPAGSIPVHLRQSIHGLPPRIAENANVRRVRRRQQELELSRFRQRPKTSLRIGTFAFGQVREIVLMAGLNG